MTSIAGAIAASIRLALAGRTAARASLAGEAEARAVGAVRGLLRGRGAGLAAVWGPPGTGKTTVYLKSFSDEMDSMEPGVLAAYVAPTNALVAETLGRLVAAVLDRAYGAAGRPPTLGELEDALSQVRAYGSRVYPGTRLDIEELAGLVDCGSLSREACIDRLSRAVRRVVHGYPTRETRWVFSTEWQDLVGRLRRALEAGPVSPTTGLSTAELGLFVDEASRSPLYRPFTAIARLLEARLARESEKPPEHVLRLLGSIDVYGLAVVGDDRQAISVHRYFHLRRDLLILRAVHGVLVGLGLCTEDWRGSACAALDVTKRLPSPSHEPVSKGFYTGMLKALEDAGRRLKPLEPAAARLREAARRAPSGVARVLEAVAHAIESRVPVVVVETGVFPPGDTFEPVRAAVAGNVAEAVAQALAEEGLTGFDVAVSSVYGELADAVRHGLRSAAKLPVRVRAATVHSLLGDEADIHVTMLGKEWRGRSGSVLDGILRDDDAYEYATIYYREPELFNVQLSRHRRLLVVIGDLQTLARGARQAASELEGKPGLRGLAQATREMAVAAHELRALARREGTLVRVAR